MLNSDEITLWQRVTAQFRLGKDSIHGPSHWLTVLRNGIYLCNHNPAEIEVVRLFALFHDSCRENEYSDPQHGPRGANLALEYHKAGHFKLSDLRLELLLKACEIHNGAKPQTDPTLAVCLDADRLDLGRVGISPDPLLLSTKTAQDIAVRQAWDVLE